MMHALICGLAVISAQTETPAQLVSKMIAHYYSAKTLVGTIEMSQRAGTKQVNISTQLQMQAPNKLYLQQKLSAAYGQTLWLVTSDGNSFTYDPPRGIEGKRLMESCWQNGIAFTHRSIYQAIVDSIGDRSTPLDLVMGRKEDLEFRRNQWATLDKIGDTKLGETEVTVVGGSLRDYGKAPISGQYEMYIDGKGQLLRYVEHESVAVRVNKQDVIQAVDTIWDVNIAVDAPVEPSLFKVIR